MSVVARHAALLPRYAAIVIGIVSGALAVGAPAAADEPITIGFVTHSQGDPFIQQIIDGAQAAADDLGVTLKVAQQSGSAPDGQLKLVQNLVNAGAQGVATSVPGDSMARALNEIVAGGVHRPQAWHQCMAVPRRPPGGKTCGS